MSERVPPADPYFQYPWESGAGDDPYFQYPWESGAGDDPYFNPGPGYTTDPIRIGTPQNPVAFLHPPYQDEVALRAERMAAVIDGIIRGMNVRSWLEGDLGQRLSVELLIERYDIDRLLKHISAYIWYQLNANQVQNLQHSIDVVVDGSFRSIMPLLDRYIRFASILDVKIAILRKLDMDSSVSLESVIQKLTQMRAFYEHSYNNGRTDSDSAYAFTQAMEFLSRFIADLQNFSAENNAR